MRYLPLPDQAKASVLLKEIFAGVPAEPRKYDAGSVVLYGAGELGKLALDFLSYVGIKVEFALDRAVMGGTLLGGSIPVYRPEMISEKEKYLILVTTVNAPFSEIYEQLQNQGFNKIVPFYDYALQFSDRHPLNNGWFSGPLTSEDKKQISEVLTGFGDDQSRAAYLQFLAWRILREDWIFEDCTVFKGNRFFIDQIKKAISDDERFLDVGAYDGRVFLQFLSFTGNKFYSALMIEPDEKNFELLQKTIEKLPMDIKSRISLKLCALSSESGKHGFAQGFGYASRLHDKKQNEVDIYKLDDLHFPVSFLKLHVEGHEFDVLQGGITQIQNNRPILAITVYHNRDGLWKIPVFLQEHIFDYVFYFRMHSWCGTGAVVYGVPKKI
jgi:FkbM family methyltransferase